MNRSRRQLQADSCGSKETLQMYYIGGAHWCHFANTFVESVHGGDASLRQITFATCFHTSLRVYSHRCITAKFNRLITITTCIFASSSLRQTVHTHRVSVHQASKLVAALLTVARVTASLAECNGRLPPGQATAGFMTHVTCMLTAKNRDQLRNPTLGNWVWATFYLHVYLLTYLFTFNCVLRGKEIKTDDGKAAKTRMQSRSGWSYLHSAAVKLPMCAILSTESF